MSNAKNASGGLGTGMVLFLIFLVLKLTNTITWSWWWVCSPLWIPFSLVIGFYAIFLLIVFLFK